MNGFDTSNLSVRFVDVFVVVFFKLFVFVFWNFQPNFASVVEPRRHWLGHCRRMRPCRKQSVDANFEFLYFFFLFSFSLLRHHLPSFEKKICDWLCPSPPFRILPTQKLLLIIIPWVKGTRVSCAAKFAVLHACLSDRESCFRRSHLPELDPASLETRKTSPAVFLQARRVAEMCCLLHFPGNPRIGERHFTGPKQERERDTHIHTVANTGYLSGENVPLVHRLPASQAI